MKLTWKKISTVMMCAALVLPAFGMTGGTRASAAESAYKIVSFGDSLTAGYQPDRKPDEYYGFVPRLEEQAKFRGRAEVDNYGISGLTSSGLNHFVEAVQSGTNTTAATIQAGIQDPNAAGFAAKVSQIRGDVAEADVITITIGGNDLLPLLMARPRPTAEQLGPKVEELLKNYAANVDKVVDSLQLINPNARIVIADQYQPVSEAKSEGLYPQLNQAALSYTKTLDTLAAKRNAEGGKVEVVHVVSLFAGKESALTYIDYNDIHPNQDGYEALAEAFSKKIWNEYRTLNKAVPASTVAVVVSGKELDTKFKPILKNSTTFVVLRDITDALGAKLKWDNKTSTASIDFEGRSVSIPVGKKAVVVNGKNVAIKTPAFTEKVSGESKTYVPLAVLADGLGFDVQYVPRLRAVFVNP
ncbi:stalk domain-containing protein [Saccharibacillus alkalitolerans]|uniref:Copper amine oxidase n=1 Tax=Saccharibacillus alkalitolerans TaxID=2705290 RepID=A0ABX0F939_9BACL|nr:GDSL-type esterase/lipase family protein [Saccharibacillus alkalitolerans]NGZ77476.1 copper amine oxidase [Saccharibacillus alkalitolerans]